MSMFAWFQTILFEKMLKSMIYVTKASGLAYNSI